MHPKGQNYFSDHYIISGNGLNLEIRAPVVMGVININNDSFFQGSRVKKHDEILKKVEEMILNGASIIDFGATSSRPGAPILMSSNEMEVLIPILKKVRKFFPALFISVDTYNADTAKIVFNMGINMINDISGGSIDIQMLPFISKTDVAYVLMHMKDIPANMQANPIYHNFISELFSFFSNRLNILKQAGRTKNILIDPGFGFGKTLEDNYLLLSEISRFRNFGFPVLVGLSRKSMIYKMLEITPDQALNGTSVLHSIALLNGASVLRVHDVKEANEAIRIIHLYFKATLLK